MKCLRWVFIAFAGISSSAAADFSLAWGENITFDQCENQPSAVWADFPGGEVCLRYFGAGDLQNAQRVIVMLRGDRDRWVTRDPADIPNNTAKAQYAIAKNLAQKSGMPVVVLSRPGTYGSSGDHRRRRQIEEFSAIDKALDAIKDRYDIGQFVLWGHSGGATAAAAILTMGRRDIICAVLTSGAFDLLNRAEMLRIKRGAKPLPGHDLTGLPNPYDPLDHVAGITADPSRKIYILGSRHDRITPFRYQQAFYSALIAYGHNAELQDVSAKAPDFHNLTGDIGLKTAVNCAK